MKSMSREVLARDATDRLRAAACKDLGRLWNRQEARHAAAPRSEAAAQAAAPLLEVCATCPVLASCRAWAEVDQYTGIAAGTAWVNGTEKPAHWVRRQAPRPIAS